MHFRPTSFLVSPQAPPLLFSSSAPPPALGHRLCRLHLPAVHPSLPFSPYISVCHLDSSAPKRSCPHPDLNRRVWGSHSRFCCPPIPFPCQRMGSFTASEPFPVRAQPGSVLCPLWLLPSAPSWMEAGRVCAMPSTRPGAQLPDTYYFSCSRSFSGPQSLPSAPLLTVLSVSRAWTSLSSPLSICLPLHSPSPWSLHQPPCV